MALAGIGAGAGLAPPVPRADAGCRRASSTGCAASPPSCSPAAPRTRRGRCSPRPTSCAAHHAGAARGVPVLGRARLRLALALVVLALHYAADARRPGGPPLRRRRCSCCCWCRSSSRRCAPYAAAYQDRMHAPARRRGAVRAARRCREPQPALPVRTVAARGVTVAFENVALHLGPRARPGAGRPELPRARRRDAGAGRAVRRRQIHRHRDPARLRPAGSRAGDAQRRRHRHHRAAGAVAPDRLDRPAPDAVRRHASATTSASPGPRRPTTRSRRRPAWPGSTASPPGCRRGSTRWSARAATGCPAARRSAWRSRARS